MSRISKLATFSCGLFSELKFDGFLFLTAKTLSLYGVTSFLTSAFTVDLSPFSVRDCRNFMLLAKGLIVEPRILAARSCARGVFLLLLKFLGIADCVVLFVVVFDIAIASLGPSRKPKCSHFK